MLDDSFTVTVKAIAFTYISYFCPNPYGLKPRISPLPMPLHSEDGQYDRDWFRNVNFYQLAGKAMDIRDEGPRGCGYEWIFVNRARFVEPFDCLPRRTSKPIERIENVESSSGMRERSSFTWVGMDMRPRRRVGCGERDGVGGHGQRYAQAIPLRTSSYGPSFGRLHKITIVCQIPI